MKWAGKTGKTSTLILAVLAVLFSVSMGVILASFGEHVNALWLVVAAVSFYVLAYRTYGSFIAARILALDDSNSVPSHTKKDGQDYVPTNKTLLFGHHFAAIAGAGPLIGPVLAAQFGYLPGFLWILIGAVFAGAVHDFVILVASVRKGGRSLAAIAREEVGELAGAVCAITVFLIIVVAMAGLSIVVINAMKESAWSTFTLLSTVPIAMLMGFYIFRFRTGAIGEGTLIGLTLLALSLVGGGYLAESTWGSFFQFTRNEILFGLAVYAFIASILPVWLLLTPRDYLSSYLKIGVIGLLGISVVFLAPEIQMPAVTGFAGGHGPIIPGEIFPFMFITIACGALSGFHALVSSGTTPKMIDKESDTVFIGYGAMLMEGFVGIMALIAATVLVPGDYFAINSHLSAEALAAMGFPVSDIKELALMVQEETLEGRTGGAVSLAVGMAFIFKSVPLLSKITAVLYHFAIVFEAVFILTTIDAGTRVARYIFQDAAGYLFPKMRDIHWFPGMLFASFTVTALWSGLVYTGSVSTIWPLFGITNQLLAGIALGIGIVYLLNRNKGSLALVAGVPFAFIILITVYASYRQVFADGFGFLFRLRDLPRQLAEKQIDATHYSAMKLTYTLDIILLALIILFAGIIIGSILKRAWVKIKEKGDTLTAVSPAKEQST